MDRHLTYVPVRNKHRNRTCAPRTGNSDALPTELIRHFVVILTTTHNYNSLKLPTYVQ